MQTQLNSEQKLVSKIKLKKLVKKTIGKKQHEKKISLKSMKNWKWPEDYIKNLPNPWEGEDSNEWLKKERGSWDD